MSKENIIKSLNIVYEMGASDIHFKVGYTFFRVKSRLISLDISCSDEDMIDFFESIASEKVNRNTFKRSYEFGFDFKDARLRGILFHDNDGFCLSIRILKLISSDFAELGLPPIIESIINRRSGLILITGSTGSGKSTTLAAIVNYLNNHNAYHIITIEDPIEYLYSSNISLISQKELGRDVSSFDRAIIECMREDPDVIVVGEIRDKESCEAALRAAETGHLVFATLHTRSAASTITRIIDMYPSAAQNQVLNQLSNSIVAVITQNLLPPADINDKLALATEVMINNTAISANIRSNKIVMIDNLIDVSSREGMISMRHSIDNLLDKGLITQETHDLYSK